MTHGWNIDLITQQAPAAKRGYRLCAGPCGSTIPMRGGKLYCAACSDRRRIETLRDYNRRRKPRVQRSAS